MPFSFTINLRCWEQINYNPEPSFLSLAYKIPSAYQPWSPKWGCSSGNASHPFKSQPHRSNYFLTWSSGRGMTLTNVKWLRWFHTPGSVSLSDLGEDWCTRGKKSVWSPHFLEREGTVREGSDTNASTRLQIKKKCWAQREWVHQGSAVGSLSDDAPAASSMKQQNLSGCIVGNEVAWFSTRSNNMWNKKIKNLWFCSIDFRFF